MELDYVKLKQIKPAIATYIRESRALLNKSAIPDDRAVHDVRVRMKISRALLKLAAPQLDRAYHDRNMADLRGVGKMICSLREASVQRKTLKVLRKEYPDIFSQLHENDVLSHLLEKKVTIAEPSDEIKAELEQIDILLNKTGYRIRFQPMNIIDPQTLLKELEFTFIRVTDIYLSCRNNPKPKTMHKFRKKAKDFLYQLYIFRSLNPAVIKVLEKKLDSMTQNLGKFNDLDQTIKALGYSYKAASNPPVMDELIVKIREKQDRYLSKVWPLAYQIFCPGQKLVNVLGFKLLII